MHHLVKSNYSMHTISFLFGKKIFLKIVLMTKYNLND